MNPPEENILVIKRSLFDAFVMLSEGETSHYRIRGTQTDGGTSVAHLRGSSPAKAGSE